MVNKFILVIILISLIIFGCGDNNNENIRIKQEQEKAIAELEEWQKNNRPSYEERRNADIEQNQQNVIESKRHLEEVLAARKFEEERLRKEAEERRRREEQARILAQQEELKRKELEKQLAEGKISQLPSIGSTITAFDNYFTRMYSNYVDQYNF